VIRWLMLTMTAVLCCAWGLTTTFSGTGSSTESGASRLGDFSDALDALVPVWYPPAEATTNKASAVSWTQYDVTCECASDPCTVDGGGGDSCTPTASTAAFPNSWSCSPADPADGGSDHANVNCQIAAAADESVLYFKAGTYNASDGNSFLISRDKLVIRGAGTGSTLFKQAVKGQNSPAYSTCEQADSNMCACGSRSTFHVYKEIGGGVNSAGTVVGADNTAWTAGYAVGTTDITVAANTNIDVGEYILLYDPNSNWVAKLDNEPPHGGDVNWFMHMTKVSGVSGTTITLDRPLRLAYGGVGTEYVHHNKAGSTFYVESVGFEDFAWTVTSPAVTSSAICGKYVVESWMFNLHMYDAWENFITLEHSARNWIEGNKFDGLVDTDAEMSNNYGVHLHTGSIDHVIENNIFNDLENSYVPMGGTTGNVYAYNYDLGQATDSRVLPHGVYTSQGLYEGNHMKSGRFEHDDWWGRHGPGKTIYRHRSTFQARCWNDGTSTWTATPCVTTADCGGGETCQESQFEQGITFENFGSYAVGWDGSWHILASAVGSIHGRIGCASDPGAACQPIDENGTDELWIERNVIRGCKEGDGTHDCGSISTWGGHDPQSLNIVDYADPPGPATTHESDNAWPANSAPGGWSGFSGPDSLYRDSAPLWWCEQACDWDLQTGIGAFGDDITVGSEAGLCDLPAKIREDSGACTPL